MNLLIVDDEIVTTQVLATYSWNGYENRKSRQRLSF